MFADIPMWRSLPTISVLTIVIFLPYLNFLNNNKKNTERVESREPQKDRGEHEAGGKFKRCSDTSMNLIENSMTTTISYSNMLTVILSTE